MSQSNTLEIFVQSLEKIGDPRSKQGVSHQFQTILAIVFLGLLANISALAEIERWAKIRFQKLEKFLQFKKGVPHAITFARVLRKISLTDLQNVFAEFLNIILASSAITAAVDGKAAKQMKDENGDPLLMLNIFAQKLKLHLASWSVRGDKTNEPGCLKNHLGELFTMYPCLKLLTGDAIFAQRPLLLAIQEYHRDYLVQIKDNQSNVLKQMKLMFADSPTQKPGDCRVSKKRGLLKSANCG